MTDNSDSKGCLWTLVYLGAMLSGSLALSFYAIHLIKTSEDSGSPATWPFLVIIASVVGASGGLIVAGLGHFLLWIARVLSKN